MTIHLPDGRHVSVESHSGQIWLSSYNGCGTVNPLNAEQAMELGQAMFHLGRRMKKGRT